MAIDLVIDEQSALSAAWKCQRTGNFVAALDHSRESLRRWPDSHGLQYLAILALASCGATQAAIDALRASGLGAGKDEDSQALEARLLKDMAFGRFSAGAGPLAEAAGAYERVAERTGGTYSRQNAALLWMLAGDEDRALRLAAAVVHQLRSAQVPGDEQGAYFYWATLAEAALVLGDHAGFERARSAADPMCRRNAWARSRTVQQMLRLGTLRPECAALVKQWYRPPVGLVLEHAAAGGLGEAAPVEAGDLPALAFCFGRRPEFNWRELATLGVQLHAIYPDVPPDQSMPPASDIQPERDASGSADTHTWSSLLLDDADDPQACAQTALGLSLGQADELRAPWVVLARAPDGWAIYRQANRATVRDTLRSADSGPATRATYAFLFADVVSYSALNTAETRRYWTQLLPVTAAAVLQRHAPGVVLRKTWGDSVHAVFKTAGEAASAALQIQEATANLSEELGRGRRLVFRMALHFGPADAGIDPVEHTPSVFGPQLSLAARIEPVAPPGGVFVTEAFAARLSLEGAHIGHCSYVGTTQLPKSYGRVRLLRLV